MSGVLTITSIGYWGAYPGADAATSSFLLELEGIHVLIDCGSGVLQNLQAYIQPDELDAVVITHYHADHVADLGCLQYAIRVSQSMGEQSGPLPIYGHDEDDGCEALTYRTHTVFRPYTEGQSITIGSLSFDFFKAYHTEPSFAIRVSAGKSVAVFSGDTAYHPKVVEAARQADLFYCESSLFNSFRGMVEGHLTAGEAGRIAKEAGVKELVLTHLPHYGNHLDLVKESAEEFKGPVSLNKAGLKRTLVP